MRSNAGCDPRFVDVGPDLGSRVAIVRVPGPTSLAKWVIDNAASLGTSYAHELRRHYRT
jgi:hypothetical protein